MESLREFAVAIIVTLLVLMMTVEVWVWLIPERFTVRYLLVAATVISIILGACVAFAPR